MYYESLGVREVNRKREEEAAMAANKQKRRAAANKKVEGNSSGVKAGPEKESAAKKIFNITDNYLKNHNDSMSILTGALTKEDPKKKSQKTTNAAGVTI